MTRKFVLYAIWISFSLASLIVVIWVFRGSVGGLVQLLSDLGVSVYIWVAVLAIMKEMLGALKWQVAHRALAGEVSEENFVRRFEATTLGSLGAQFLPAQISHLLVRWFYYPNIGVQRWEAAGSTLYEQFCDLVLYIGLAVLFVAYFWLDAPYWVLMLFGLLFVPLFRNFMDIVVWVCTLMIRFLGKLNLLKSAMYKAQVVADQSGVIATGDEIKILLLSALVTLLRCMQIYAIIYAISPEIDAVLVAAAYPITGLISAIPLTPAGLGLTELSWSAFLISAGATPPLAAMAAVSLRLVTFIVLLGLMALFLLLRLIRIEIR